MFLSTHRENPKEMKKKVKIFDKEYELDYKEESNEYADKVIRYVEDKFRVMSKFSKTKSLPDIFLLVSLNLADEVIEEREKRERLIQVIKTGIDNLGEIKRGSLSCS